ncbi:broad-complex core protein isoforms 1/2/3/4/5 isoform X2 [Belonocnema kinseyi]|uniref:broad-complex core protein isoforms 1/2/3/4/5 isoform X2 n=1 Tax=Belonocnema kinseyi TaxID=2817044 RepID=UPI00143D485D|nr:broad-complex core protein isoforms 1/2/3/4/5 isoform X2 [Belonocnema kinseyi]
MSSTVVTVKKALSQRRIRRRRCKFIGTWLCHRQFKRWLTPVRGDNHKAYCALCDKIFSVAHGGLHDVRAHWKGKRHISLESSLSQSQRAQRLQRAAGLVDRSHLVPSASSYRNRKLLLGRVEPDDVEFCEQENKLVVKKRFAEKKAREGRSQGVGSSSSEKKSDTQKFEAEDVEEFEDSDRFEFEQQSYEDDDVDEDIAPGEDGGNETANLSSIEGVVEEVVVPSLRMLQQRNGSASATPPATSNMFPQQYCLRWKYHHSNLQTMFSQLLERQAYCDVTLACEGKTLRAHKVVLSACSTYFDTILSQYEEKDPIVIMRDVKFSDIKVLVEFMYKGEINIDHTRLSSLLKTAEDLHIKGLAEVSWRSDSGQNDLANSGHSPGAATPGVETVLREGDVDEPPIPKQRRRGRPPLDDPPSAHDVFTPKITCITGNVGTEGSLAVNQQQEEMMSEGGDHESWDDEMMMSNENNDPSLPMLSYLSKDDGNDLEKKAPNAPSNSNATNPAIPEQFRDVVKMNDYLTTGRRQEFWEEPFTRRVMDAIKSKELEMKTAAEILGVSYGTLYGRYRDSYGCLKHPYSFNTSRVRDFWSEPGPAEVLAKLRRKEITLFRAAEFLNVTVHTLATYLSTLQGPDRISLAGELSGGASNVDGSNELENNDTVNEILQKLNVNVNTTAVAAPTTSTPIKREGGGYIEVPNVVQKAATSVLENNPDITIVKTENMSRKREFAKVSSTENNNAKLLSGGAVSEITPQQQQQQVLQQVQQQQKISEQLSLNNDSSKP